VVGTEEARNGRSKREPAGGSSLMGGRSDLRRQWLCVELPVTDYLEVWRLQTRLVAARSKGRPARDVLLLTEHTPVFTLGRRGGLENLKVPCADLERAGVPVIRVERGGNITYHGPGQLVLYPVVDLLAAGFKVVDYVWRLEEVVIRAAAAWGLRAERNPMNRGAWVGRSKLASVGIAVRRGISFHGIALNVNLSIEPFRWIHPCGLPDIGVTTMEREIGRPLSMAEVRHTVKEETQGVFGVELVPRVLSDLEVLLAREDLHD
jgi:lipoate-protein ligase B